MNAQITATAIKKTNNQGMIYKHCYGHYQHRKVCRQCNDKQRCADESKWDKMVTRYYYLGWLTDEILLKENNLFKRGEV